MKKSGTTEWHAATYRNKHFTSVNNCLQQLDRIGPHVPLTCSGFLLDVSHLCSILDQLLLDLAFMFARSWVCGYQLCSFLDINCFHLEVTPAQKMRRSNHPGGNTFSAFVSWLKQSTLHPWLTNSPTYQKSSSQSWPLTPHSTVKGSTSHTWMWAFQLTQLWNKPHTLIIRC